MPESAKCSAWTRWQGRHSVDGPAARAAIAVRQTQDKSPRGIHPSYSSFPPGPAAPLAPGARLESGGLAQVQANREDPSVGDTPIRAPSVNERVATQAFAAGPRQPLAYEAEK